MTFLRYLETIRTPLLDAVMQFVTLFGEETLFMVIAMMFFWCVNKRHGYFLLYVSFFGATLNQFLKLLFCIPRPWVLDPEFTIVESAQEAATGYSFPSGHTQSAAGLFLGIGRFTGKWGARIGCIALTLLVGFSRMYLGVHTPADVLVSLGIAVLLVMVAFPLFYRAWRDHRWYYPLCGALLALGFALIIYTDFFPMPANAIPAFSLDGAEMAYKMLGASLGLVFTLWLDTRYIQFETKAVWWAQILKCSLGLALIIAVRLVTKAPLLALTCGHNLAHLIRYFLMVAVGGVVWPLTFRYFGKLGQTPASDYPQAD